MCDLTAFLLEKQDADNHDSDRRPIMQSVTSVIPEGDGIILTDIFGETKFLKAHIDALMDNNVFLRSK